MDAMRRAQRSAPVATWNVVLRLMSCTTAPWVRDAAHREEGVGRVLYAPYAAAGGTKIGCAMERRSQPARVYAQRCSLLRANPSKDGDAELRSYGGHRPLR